MNCIVPPACAKPLGRTLCVSRESVVEKVFRTEKSVQFENEVRIDNRLESEVEKSCCAERVIQSEKVF